MMEGHVVHIAVGVLLNHTTIQNTESRYLTSAQLAHQLLHDPLVALMEGNHFPCRFSFPAAVPFLVRERPVRARENPDWIVVFRDRYGFEGIM
jgi:hypothetical protein